MLGAIVYAASVLAVALAISIMLQRSGTPLEREDIPHFIMVVVLWPLFVAAFLGLLIGHMTRDRNEEVEKSMRDHTHDGGFYG